MIRTLSMSVIVTACLVALAASPALAKKGKPAGGKKPEAVQKPEDARPADLGGASAVLDPPERRGMARMEFGERRIQGQTNKANAIYLVERRESALRSLLKQRTDFRGEIDDALEQ